MDAMALYKTILQHHPENTQALEGAGLILIDEKQLDEALENFEQVQKLDSHNHSSVAEIGWIYCEKKEYEKAITYMTKALEVAGMDVAEYYYRLGRIYWSMEGTYQ